MSEFKGTQHYRKVANQVKFTWPITLRSTGLDELSGRYGEDVSALCDYIERQQELLELCRDYLAELDEEWSSGEFYGVADPATLFEILCKEVGEGSEKKVERTSRG